MEDVSQVDQLRQAGQRVLREKYGVMTPVTGQGVQKGTRFAIIDSGKRLVCTIKVAAGEEIHRIHFPRSEDGGWSTLRDVDRVLYVRRAPGQKGQFEAQMHSKDVLLEIFDKNHDHAVKKGIGHLPVWLSPDLEEGDRFVGSGFGERALWIVKGPLQIAEGGKTLGAVTIPSDVQPLTIPQAKNGIAAGLGISPDAIEIIIRT